MAQSRTVALRASAFKVLAGTDMCRMGAPKEDMLIILQGGLEDSEDIDVGSLIFPLCVSHLSSSWLIHDIFISRSVSSLYVLQKTIS